MEDKYITIPNLDHYQHYGDRKIVWLKLHVNILHDYAFSSLNNAEKWFYIGLLMLAARNDNAVPVQPSYILKQISNGRISFKNTVDKLVSLGLIAVNPLAECYQVAIPIRREEKREEEIRKEETKSDNFVSSNNNDELQLETTLKDWNERQSSPMPDFKPMNIIKKHGVEKIERLYKECGREDNGFSLFMRRIKE